MRGTACGHLSRYFARRLITSRTVDCSTRISARARVLAALPRMDLAASRVDGPLPCAAPIFAGAFSTEKNTIIWCVHALLDPPPTFPLTARGNSIDLPVGPRKEVHRNC